MLKVFTVFKSNPLHPRLEMQMNWWKQNGILVEVYFLEPEKGIFYKFLNRLFLKTVRWDLVQKFKSEIKPNDRVLIYDFSLLPLAKIAVNKNATVFYETLDDNPYLYQAAFEKKGKLFSWLKPIILPWLINREQNALEKYVQKVIVNSPNLLKLKSTNCYLLPYSSPFESVKRVGYQDGLPACFIYIGKLTTTKGAREYKELVESCKLDFFFAGEARDDFSKKWIDSLPKKCFLGYLNSNELSEKIIELQSNYNLIGLSIIWPENMSYALQEANKDVDYMCLEIPFIGNERVPTFEKIKAGAAVLFSDLNSINKLITNKRNKYTEVQEVQKSYYEANFSTLYFFSVMKEVYDKNLFYLRS
jgi:hypothetical protein